LRPATAPRSTSTERGCGPLRAFQAGGKRLRRRQDGRDRRNGTRMHTIKTTAELADICEAAKQEAYVTLDTEFLRERTYFSKLCLVQMALPGKSGRAVLIDPLAEGLSMEPLYDLFRHEGTVKVFHAARQDLEIFFFE